MWFGFGNTLFASQCVPKASALLSFVKRQEGVLVRRLGLVQPPYKVGRRLCQNENNQLSFIESIADFSLAKILGTLLMLKAKLFKF